MLHGFIGIRHVVLHLASWVGTLTGNSITAHWLPRFLKEEGQVAFLLLLSYPSLHLLLLRFNWHSCCGPAPGWLCGNPSLAVTRLCNSISFAF